MKDDRTILIIDDDPIFLTVAEIVLTGLGKTHIVTARNGEDGVLAFEKADPPVGMVFLDLNMPRMDGLGFLRQLAALRYRGTIILASGETGAVLGSARHLGDMLGLRIVGALRKPLKPHEVSEMLEHAAQMTRERTIPPLGSSVIALEDVVIVPFYQPQVDVRTGQILSAEALTRVALPDGALTPPGDLFERARAANRLQELSMCVVDRVFADILHWRMLGLDCRVSINMDVGTIEVPRFAETLIRRARELGVPSWSVCFELTESALPEDQSRLVESLTRLRMAKFPLSLDDYGTGSANYDVLRMCPFSELKVDRTIVRAAPIDPIAEQFVTLAVSIGRELGLDVIAEGVETEAELVRMRQLGINVVQGYHCGRPQPRDGLIKLLQKQATANAKAATVDNPPEPVASTPTRIALAG